ncbi:MAG: abortive infection family protein [Atopobiaceae bacterium]|nr:abortive infection family protein [Atopobiaceae bacterium]
MAEIGTLTAIEKGAFLSLFNRGGYVLNFNTNDFDAFTMQSVGLALTDHYKASKGKSLTAFVNEGEDQLVVKLLDDLLSYYELHYQSEIEADSANVYGYGVRVDYAAMYKKCREYMDRCKAGGAYVTLQKESIAQRFTSDYMHSQIDILFEMRTTNPTEAIGKAKELIENCCKTILEDCGMEYDKNWTVAQLTKHTMKLLRVTADDINEGTPAGDKVKAILGSLQGIAGNVAELRNTYGAGHGKSDSYTGLSIRHAKLAVGSSVTLVEYLWETYEWREKTGTLNVSVA